MFPVTTWPEPLKTLSCSFRIISSHQFQEKYFPHEELPKCKYCCQLRAKKLVLVLNIIVNVSYLIIKPSWGETFYCYTIKHSSRHSWHNFVKAKQIVHSHLDEISSEEMLSFHLPPHTFLGFLEPDLSASVNIFLSSSLVTELYYIRSYTDGRQNKYCIRK